MNSKKEETEMADDALQTMKEGMSGGLVRKTPEEKTFELVQRKASVLAKSRMIPMHFRENLADCIIAMEMADRMGEGVFQTMQSLYIIHGNPTWKAEYIISKINSSNKFKGLLKYRFEGQGKNRSCTAYAVDKRDGDLCEVRIDWATVAAEGWDKKPGSKWLTMPDQMFRYRTGAWFARTYCPEVLMGTPSYDEVVDSNTEIEDVVIEETVYSEKDEEPALPTNSIPEVRDENIAIDTDEPPPKTPKNGRRGRKPKATPMDRAANRAARKAKEESDVHQEAVNAPEPVPEPVPEPEPEPEPEPVPEPEIIDSEKIEFLVTSQIQYGIEDKLEAVICQQVANVSGFEKVPVDKYQKVLNEMDRIYLERGGQR
jgi:hypothetical protein